MICIRLKRNILPLDILICIVADKPADILLCELFYSHFSYSLYIRINIDQESS